jgi:tetratricopeptide (TPR) repeat protein
MKAFQTKRCLALALLVLLSGGVYFNTLQNDFVWDDRALFIENYAQWDVKNLKRLLTSQDNLFSDKYTGYYRPLPNITFLIDRYLWGSDPAGYHLTNVIVHILSTLVVFFMVVQISGRFYIGLTGSLLFAVHPIHTEVVAWINGRNNMVAGLFYLLSFHYYVRHRNHPNIKILFLSLVALACSLFSKEYALTFPIVILLHELSFHSAAFSQKDLKRLGLLLMPYLFVMAGYLVLRSLVLPDHGMKSLHLETFWVRLMTLPKILLTYLKLLAFPFNLSAVHDVSSIEHPYQPAFLLCLMLLAALLVAWRWTFYKSRILFFGAGWMFVTILPALNLIPLSDTDMTFLAERYLYLPAVGFCMMGGWLIVQLSGLRLVRTTTVGRCALGGFVLIIAEIYAFETAKRNLVWRNELSLWRDTVKKAPDNFLPHTNLAISLARGGELDEALNEISTAIQLSPRDDTLHFVLGQVLYQKRLYRESLKAVERALALNPGHLDALNLRGNIAFETGDLSEAVTCYQRVATLAPWHFNAQFNLGLAFYKLGEFEKAIPPFRKAAQIEPQNPRPAHYLNRIHEKL